MVHIMSLFCQFDKVFSFKGEAITPIAGCFLKSLGADRFFNDAILARDGSRFYMLLL